MNNSFQKVVASSLLVLAVSPFAGRAYAQNRAEGTSSENPPISHLWDGAKLKAGAPVAVSPVPPSGNPPASATPGSSDQDRHPTQAAPGIMSEGSLTPRDRAPEGKASPLFQRPIRLLHANALFPLLKAYHEEKAAWDESKNVYEITRSVYLAETGTTETMWSMNVRTPSAHGVANTVSIDVTMREKDGQQTFEGSAEYFGKTVGAMLTLASWTASTEGKGLELSVKDPLLAQAKAGEAQKVMVAFARVCQAMGRHEMPSVVDRNTLAQHFAKGSQTVPQFD